MKAKRKIIKCGCGGRFEEKTQKIQGVECDVMVCDSCREIIFTLKQLKEFRKLQQIRNEPS